MMLNLLPFISRPGSESCSCL